MDLTQIRYFLALARTLNFTRAAEACHVTQPALTKSIQRLEEELGGPLLLRERALTQLTPLGAEMLPLLEQIQAAAKRAKDHAAGLRSRIVAPLRLGIAPDAPLPPFGPILAELERRLPGFELRLVEAAPADMADGLLKGELDLGVVTEAAPLPSRMNRWALFADRVVLLVPDGHALAAAATVPREAIGGWIRCAAAATVFDAIDPALPAPRHRAATPAQAAHLARAGLGIAFSTERAAGEPGLSKRCLSGQARHDVVLIAVAGRPIASAADAFLKLARARAWAPL